MHTISALFKAYVIVVAFKLFPASFRSARIESVHTFFVSRRRVPFARARAAAHHSALTNNLDWIVSKAVRSRRINLTICNSVELVNSTLAEKLNTACNRRYTLCTVWTRVQYTSDSISLRSFRITTKHQEFPLMDGTI